MQDGDRKATPESQAIYTLSSIAQLAYNER